MFGLSAKSASMSAVPGPTSVFLSAFARATGYHTPAGLLTNPVGPAPPSWLASVNVVNEAVTTIF
jgi:hypothetical protein